jgi:phage repressor protein C with HTH and peptisase S24 domain
MPLSDRLTLAMSSAGISQADLARACKVKPPSVHGWLSGKAKFLRGENLLLAAAALGVNQQWLATGEGPMLPETGGNSLAVHATALTPAPAHGMPAVHVPVLANAGSMGFGTEMQHDDVLVGHIALSEQWVARRLHPSSHAALRFIHAYGDSMSPTFEDGDILLVDTGIKDPKTIDGVYVMAANDRIYIKRVRQRMDKAIEISSDNATVKTVDVLNGDHSIDILGRVVWCWNGRKL